MKLTAETDSLVLLCYAEQTLMSCHLKLLLYPGISFVHLVSQHYEFHSSFLYLKRTLEYSYQQLMIVQTVVVSVSSLDYWQGILSAFPCALTALVAYDHCRSVQNWHPQNSASFSVRLHPDYQQTWHHITLPRKKSATLLLNISVKNQPILIIFDRQHA